MPCLIRVLTPTALETVKYSADSLADAARYEPHDGVYTVANTFNATQVLKFDAHLDRLENSARLAGIKLQLERDRLRTALRQMIIKSGYGDVRYRITAAKNTSESLILSIEPFHPLAESVYKTGVRLITTPGSTRNDPLAKKTSWMHDRKAIEEALPLGIFTALLLSESGDILEGISSNFYGILGDELRTAGEGVLPGIAQQIVFEIASKVVALRREAINIRELPRLDEAFITSSSRGIVPVIEIDGIQIGKGIVGEKTSLLREHYLAWVNAHLEEL